MPEWWSERGGFFDEDYLSDFLVQMTDEATLREVQFVSEALHLSSSRLLDVAGGVGRHSVPLASFGNHVTVLDLSDTYLRAAQASAAKAGTSLQVLKCDMSELAIDSRFDAAICMHTSFGYYDTDSAHVQALAAIFCSLRPGGRFLLDLDNRERTIRHFKEYEWFETSNAFVLRSYAIDLRRNRLIQHIVRLNSDGGKRVDEISARMFSLSEITAIATVAGFSLDAVYGDYEIDCPYTIESPRMIVCLVKPQAKGGD